MAPLPLAGVVALLASASSTADEETARARLLEKLEDAGARVVARSSSRVSHAVVLLPPGASSSASALKQCITVEELRGLHGRLAGVRAEEEEEGNGKRRRRTVNRVFFSFSLTLFPRTSQLIHTQAGAPAHIVTSAWVDACLQIGKRITVRREMRERGGRRMERLFIFSFDALARLRIFRLQRPFRPPLSDSP